MGCDVLRLYGDLADTLPTADDQPAVVLNQTNVPAPPHELVSDELVMVWDDVNTNGHFRGEQVSAFVTPRLSRALGLLVVATVLHATPDPVDVRLTHRGSRVRTLRLSCPHFDEEGETGSRTITANPDVWLRPVFYRYAVDGWVDGDAALIRITEDGESGGADDDWWRHRDTVCGFGSATAALRVAQFLLDMPVIRNHDSPAYWGPDNVDRHSAELQLRFPSDYNNPPEDWESLPHLVNSARSHLSYGVDTQRALVVLGIAFGIFHRDKWRDAEATLASTPKVQEFLHAQLMALVDAGYVERITAPEESFRWIEPKT